MEIAARFNPISYEKPYLRRKTGMLYCECLKKKFSMFFHSNLTGQKGLYLMPAMFVLYKQKVSAKKYCACCRHN